MYFFKATTPDVWTSRRKLRLHERLAIRWPYTPLHVDPQRDTGARHYLVLIVALSACAVIAFQLPFAGMAAVICALIVAFVAIIVLVAPFIIHGIAMDTLEVLQRDHAVRFSAMQDTPGFGLIRAYRQWIEAGGLVYVLSADHQSQLDSWLERYYPHDAEYVRKLANTDVLTLSEVADIKLRSSLDAVVSFYELSHLPGYDEFMGAYDDSIHELKGNLEQSLAAEIKQREYEEGMSAARTYRLRCRLEALRSSTTVT